MSTIKVITPREQNLLLSVALDGYPRDHMMIYLCLNTGLRNSELIHLLISDIKDDDHVSTSLTVRPQYAKGGFIRSIPFAQPTIALLNNFLSWKDANNEQTKSNSHLFVSRYSHMPLSSRDFQRILRRLSLQSIGRSINPHVLRHTFATNLLDIANIRVIQKLLGHKRINSTQIYTHPNSDDMQNAIDNLQPLIL